MSTGKWDKFRSSNDLDFDNFKTPDLTSVDRESYAISIVNVNSDTKNNI